MKAATWPRAQPAEENLLVIDPVKREWTGSRVRSLPDFLRPGDLVVLNDAATFPGSLPAERPDGTSLEVRLIGAEGVGLWQALLFTAGSWRSPTEQRGVPLGLRLGERLVFTPHLSATICQIDPRSPRLVQLDFGERNPDFWREVYRVGHPIQYSYLAGDLSLWQVQTAYAARPWATLDVGTAVAASSARDSSALADARDGDLFHRRSGSRSQTSFSGAVGYSAGNDPRRPANTGARRPGSGGGDFSRSGVGGTSSATCRKSPAGYRDDRLDSGWQSNAIRGGRNPHRFA